MLKQVVLKSVLIAFLCSISLATHARADDNKRIDVPAGDLITALKTLARQSGIDLLYRSDQLEGLTTHGVSGSLTPQEAVTKLLEGTTLALRMDAATGAMLITTPTPPSQRSMSDPPTPLPVTGKEGARPREGERIQGEGKERGFWGGFRLAQNDQAQSSSSSRRDEGDTQNPPKHSDEQIGEMVVNARNPQQTLAQGAIPRIETGAFQFKVIDRQEIVNSGASTAPELLRNLAQNTSFGPQDQTTVTTRQGTADTSGTNLRGFGANQTLILLNDRRLGAADGQASNSLSIPLTAVERVEILPAAASAIYGFSALGGAVNYILRNDFRGVELSTHYTNSTDGEAGRIQTGVLVGGSLFHDRVNMLVALEDYRQSILSDQDRHFSLDLIRRREQYDPNLLLSPLADMPGNIRAVSGSLGIPGSTSNVASVPVGHDGVNRGPGTYAATAGSFNLDRNVGISPPGLQVRYQPKSKSQSVFAQTIFNVNPWLAVFGEYLYRKNERPNDPAGFQVGTVVTVPAANPFNPFGVPVQVGFVPLDLQWAFHSDNETTRVVAGIKGAFGETWRWSADYSYWDQTDAFFRAGFSSAPLAAALSSSDPATAYNPFADLRTQRPNSAAVLARMQLHQEEISPIHQDIYAVRAAGDLLTLPAGPLRVSIGAETRRFDSKQQFYTTVAGTPLPSFPFSPANRRVWAGYAEMQLPLIGEERGWSFMRDLSLSLASRYENYADSVSANNYALGLRYEVVKGYALRAFFGTGSFAPTVFQITPPVTTIPVASPLPDPRRGNTLTPAGYRSTCCGDPGLGPEKATSRSIGLILDPLEDGRLTLTADYWKLRKEDVILSLNNQTLLANEAFFPDHVIRGAKLPGDPAEWAGPIVEIITTPVNGSWLNTSGVDLAARYRHSLSELGTLTLSVDLSYVIDYDRLVQPVQPVQHLLGQPRLLSGAPVRSKGSVALNYTLGSLSTTFTTRRIAAYWGSQPAIELSPKIPASVEHDVVFNYRFDTANSRWGLASEAINLNVGVNNLLNKHPPFEGVSGFSPYNDPRQRYYFLNLDFSF